MNPDLESTLAAAFTPERVAARGIQQHEWELRSFLALVRLELKPERSVELGTYQGWTAALLSLVTTRHTISIDIEDHGTAESHQHAYELTNLIGNAAEKTIMPIVETVLGGPIDLLFIDDGHYYETICKEMEIWKPLVRPGGWIAFHDINPLANIGPHGIQPESIQVPRFWRELDGNKQEIISTDEHKDWKGITPSGGIGILRL